jgi:hypothetical protein
MFVEASVAVLVAAVLGQGNPPLPPEFSKLQRRSIEELKLKTEAHRQGWGLDRIRHWDLSQDSGELIFSLATGIKAVAPAQIIGTYNAEDHTWLWAWANPSIEDNMKLDSLIVRRYGEEHRIDRLIQPKWVGTEGDAWAMLAVAVMLCDEQGGYRGPAGATYVFMAFGEVTLSPKWTALTTG